MPKLKTRKSAKKRFKKTGTGKYLHFKAGRRHILTKKSSKRKRRLRGATVTKATERARLDAALPYE